MVYHLAMHLSFSVHLHRLLILQCSNPRVSINLASCPQLSRFMRFHMSKTCKLDSVWEWLPFEVKHRMNWLNLDPPTPPLKSLTNDTRVISIADYKLIAVFNVGVFERNLTYIFFRHRIFFFVFVAIMWRYCVAGGVITYSNRNSFVIQKL